MTKFQPLGQFRSAEQFREYAQGLHPSFDCALQPSGADGPLGQPYTLRNGRVIGNRFAIHPMEGWDATPTGMPSEETLRRWRHFGSSGAKLIWGCEAFAVQDDGRANPNQLFLNPHADTRAGLASLHAELIKAHTSSGLESDGLYVGLQLTHSGRFSRPEDRAAPKRAYAHPVLDAKFNVPPDTPVLTDGELEGLTANFLASAKLAQEIGFDFVDIKCCHGYLLHELLGARLRPGQYGGSFENRTRLFRGIVTSIQQECPGLDIGVRISITDKFPFSQNPESEVGEAVGQQDHVPYLCGFGLDENDPTEMDLTEPFEFLTLLQELGIQLVNITLGSPYYCQHIQRPATYPPSDGYSPPEDPLSGVLRHLAVTAECKKAFPQLGFVGSGYSYLQEWLANVAEYEVGAGHVDFVGIGRMVLSYPDFPRDVLSGAKLARKRICRTFSDCTTAPRNGFLSGCFPLDPYYKKREEFKALKAIKKKLGTAKNA